jgi:heme exporter protein CcmB
MRRSEQAPEQAQQAAAGGFLGAALRIVGKDLLVEWRSRAILYTMGFFAVLVVVIFSFAFAREGQPMHGVAGGILWVVVAFSGTLGLGRFFDRERQTRSALMLAPVSRAAIYLGKLIGMLLFIGATEAVVLPLLLVFFGLEVGHPGLLVATLALGSLGFAAVGSLFGASLMQSRSRDVLLGLLLFPIVTPVIIAGAKASAALLAAPPDAAAALLWIKLLAAFDVVFVTLSFWAFEPLCRSE